MPQLHHRLLRCQQLVHYHRLLQNQLHQIQPPHQYQRQLLRPRLQLFLPTTPNNCVDSTTWYRGSSPNKDCNWVSDNAASRCGKTGNDGTTGYESCLASCGCNTDTDTPVPAPTRNCEDSTTWYRGKTWKSCDWVSESSSSRCDKTGNDGTTAYESCLASCGSC